MAGGSGNDTYIVDNPLDAVVEVAGEGTDVVRTTLASYALDVNVENLVFTGTGSFAGTGNAAANNITGGAGDDTLLGQGGNDWLNGGLGADSMVGGTGNDIYIVDNALDVVVEAAGDGTDVVRTTLASYALDVNVENLVFTGTGSFAGIGNAAANYIAGGAGNDILVGGLGADAMTGGLGADIFRFDSSADRGDRINDYVAGVDAIEVSAAGFGGGLIAGIDLLATGHFAENLTGAADSAAGVGQFVFETDTARLWWDADGAGGGAGVVLATLSGVGSLAASEIVVIA